MEYSFPSMQGRAVFLHLAAANSPRVERPGITDPFAAMNFSLRQGAISLARTQNRRNKWVVNSWTLH
jgi:hypothetical protein